MISPPPCRGYFDKPVSHIFLDHEETQKSPGKSQSGDGDGGFVGDGDDVDSDVDLVGDGDDDDGGEDDGDGEEVVGTELALAPSLEPHSQWWAPTSLGLSS